jgi:molybdopterin-guanine dinucleotide biosynthesis protein
MTYFIGITGTHSTGKSTFVEELRSSAAERGIRTSIISDKATDCRNHGFPILKDHTFESTLWIMVSVIKDELEKGLHADLVIVDRPVMDAIGYLEAALKSTGRVLVSEQRDYLYSLANQHSTHYSLLFKTKLDESIPLGQNRDSDLRFRREADLEISRVLEKLSVPYMNPCADENKVKLAEFLDYIAQSVRQVHT